MVETNALVLDRLEDRIQGLAWEDIEALGEDLERWMRRLDEGIARIASLHLVRPDGQVAMLSTAWPTPAISVADRCCFRRMRAGEAGLLQSQRLEALGWLTGGVAHDFNLLTAILGTVHLLERHLGEAVTLALVLDAALPPCRADASRLEAVPLDLAINARDALPRGGAVTLTTRPAPLDAALLDGNADARPGSYVALSLRDDGTGMPAEVRERAFAPCFTTKPQGMGTGLGLSQLFGFIRQPGGHVAIDGTADGPAGHGFEVIAKPCGQPDLTRRGLRPRPGPAIAGGRESGWNDRPARGLPRGIPLPRLGSCSAAGGHRRFRNPRPIRTHAHDPTPADRRLPPRRRRPRRPRGRAGRGRRGLRAAGA